MSARFSPLRNLDRLFDDLAGRPADRLLALDAYRRGGTFFIHFDIPGVSPDAIEVTIDDDILTVRAERVWEEREGDELMACERRQGVFERHVYLGPDFDAEHLEARCDNGVLTVRMPVAQATQPRKIPIEVAKSDVADAAKAVEAVEAA